MGKFASGNKNRIYQRLRVSIFFLVFLVIAASSGLFYDASLRTVLSNAYHVDLQMLNTHKSASLVMQKLALNITRQIYNDNQIAFLLYGTEYNATELMTSIVHLDNYRMSIPYIDSIYIYNGGLKSVTVSAIGPGGYNIPLFDGGQAKGLFFDREIANIIGDQEGRFDRYAPIARRVQYPDGNKNLFCYTFMMTNVFGSGSITHAVFVNFSSGWMTQMAKEGENSLSRTLIIDGNGIIVFSPHERELLQNVSQESFFQRIQTDIASDNFIQRIDGQEMMVTYLTSDSNGWHYVRLTPYRSIVEEINRVIKVTLTMALVLIVLGLIASLVLSKILYKPIGAVHDRMNMLSRQNMMRKALLGVLEGSLPAAVPLHEKINASQPISVYHVIFLRLESSADPNGAFVSTEKTGLQALTDAAVSVFTQRFSVDTVDMGENGSLALILTTAGGQSSDRAYLEKTLAQLQQLVKKAGQSFSCAVSQPGASIGDLSHLYRQVREAFRYRIFIGKEAVIFAEDVQAYTDKEYAYPAAKENHMVDCIMSGDAQEARQTAKEILEGLREYSFLVIGLTVSRLAMSLSLLVREMQKGGFLELPPTVNSHILAASNLEETESFQDNINRFLYAIDIICGSMESKRDSKHTDLLQRINTLIEEKYADPCCCLNSIAESINMSAAYVGRLYKHYTLKSVSEQINTVRLNHAKRLLKEDKRLTMLEISRMVGFTSDSYFSKAFRKAHGMTPNEYRNS